jgi:hypothetical protein
MGDSAKELTVFPQVPLPSLEMLSPPVTQWKATDVTPSLYSHNSQSAYMATVLRDYFLSARFPDRYGIVSEAVKQDAMRAGELFSVCSGNRVRMENVGSLFATAIRMIPFLSPEELDAVWKSLEGAPCYASLPAPVRETLLLFKATGRRNGREMYLKAKTLLEGSGNMTPGTVRYLAASGMLGAIASGDRPASYQLWSGYKGAMFGTNEPDLLFRLLEAGSIEHKP